MKKLLLLTLVLLGGFSTAFAGTATTVYCAVSTTYTVKISL